MLNSEAEFIRKGNVSPQNVYQLATLLTTAFPAQQAVSCLEQSAPMKASLVVSPSSYYSMQSHVAAFTLHPGAAPQPSPCDTKHVGAWSSGISKPYLSLPLLNYMQRLLCASLTCSSPLAQIHIVNTVSQFQIKVTYNFEPQSFKAKEMIARSWMGLLSISSALR